MTTENRGPREVAARLRDFAEDGSPADVIYSGTEAYDQMLVRVLRQIVGKGDLFEKLADLIDCPECRMELVDTTDSAWGEVRAWMCPHCGAVVSGESR